MIKAVVDLSHWNGVNWASLKAGGVLGVIHKATQGVSDIDPKFVARKEEAVSAGLLWGAYAFGVNGDGAAQAQHFMEVAGYDGLQVLDFEDNPSAMTVPQADQFCQTIYDRMHKWPTVYVDSFHVKMLVSGSTIIPKNCPLFIAEPTVIDPAAPPTDPPGAKYWPTPWQLWQFSNGEKRFSPARFEDGIDADFFNGTEQELQEFWAWQQV